MRPERPQDAAFAWASATAIVAIAVGIGALSWGLPGAFACGLVALYAGRLVVKRAGNRSRRRRALIAAPFPEADRQLLLESYDHYERLPHELRRRFEDDVRLFLDEARITGVGVEATHELRLLVAASAVSLSLGWPAAEWDRVTEVLLYPDDFDRDYGAGRERAGEAHAWGTVILSVPTLLESFEHDRDGYHVGLHEFAHLLDAEQGEFDGMPTGLAPADRRAWTALVPEEIERVRAGRSVLDEYGAEGPVEFFPVAVEAFFERPQDLRRRHRELYEILSRYFAQDPARWDDARGLSL